MIEDLPKLEKLSLYENSLRNMTSLSIVNCKKLNRIVCDRQCLKAMVSFKVHQLSPQFGLYIRGKTEELYVVPEKTEDRLFPQLIFILADNEYPNNKELFKRNMENFGKERVFVVASGFQPFADENKPYTIKTSV